ncbi:MAG: hypothetical protein ACFB10_12025 [Salibacteraceae bacterium]
MTLPSISSLLFLFLLSCIGWSQSNQSLDFIGSIDYGYRALRTPDTDESFSQLVKNRDSYEIGKVNWRVGFNFNQRLGSKLFFKTGLRLANGGYGTKELTTATTTLPNASLPNKYKINYNYWFAEIPLALRFEINQKKFSPFIEAGVAPSVYLVNRNRIFRNGEASTEFVDQEAIYGFNRLHWVGTLSFGANYNLNEKFQFFGQPTFRYHFTKVADAPIREYHYNFGLELGVRKRFSYKG